MRSSPSLCQMISLSLMMTMSSGWMRGGVGDVEVVEVEVVCGGWAGWASLLGLVVGMHYKKGSNNV